MPRLLLISTTWWPSTALLATVLQDAGFEVTMLCPKGHPAWTTKIRACLELKPSHHFRSIAEAVSAVSPFLLVPMDDRAAAHIRSFHAMTSRVNRELIERSIGAPESFATIMSRTEIIAAARQVGMPTPADSRVVRREDLDRHPLPFVIKLDGSTGGQGVRIVRKQEEARLAFRALLRKKGPLFALKRRLVDRDPYSLADWRGGSRPVVSAQSYVDGRPATLALFCRDGEVMGATMAEAASQAHPTGPSTFVQLIRHDALMQQTRALIRQLRLSGFYGLDFMLDHKTGAAVFIEMNPRITPLCALRTGDGQDPVSGIVSALLGTAGRNAAMAEPRALYANFPLAWRIHKGDARLDLCRDDMPKMHPDFIAEALKTPWNQRGLLAQLYLGSTRLLQAVRPAGSSGLSR